MANNIRTSLYRPKHEGRPVITIAKTAAATSKNKTINSLKPQSKPRPQQPCQCRLGLGTAQGFQRGRLSGL